MADQDDEDLLYGEEKPVAQPAPKPPKSDIDPYLKQFQESQAGVLSSAAGQLAAAQKGAEVAKAGLGALEEQERGALGGLRARSGQAFAAQQAQGGGGSLAGMRQAQLSRGVAEGQLMGDFGMQKIAQQRLAAQAEKEAQQAAGEYATTAQKLKQQEADRARAQSQEVETEKQKIADLWKQRYSDTTWWSREDAIDLANEIRAKYKNHPNPQVRAAAEQAANDMTAMRPSFFGGFSIGKGQFKD